MTDTDPQPGRAPSCPPWPRPTGNQTWFSAMSSHSHEVTLRWPDTGELLCPTCAAHLLAESGAHVPGLPPAPEPGHRCEASFSEPLWMVRDARCRNLPSVRLDALPGTYLFEHAELPDGRTCACATVAVYTAVHALTPADRQAAVDAHLRLIRALSDHLLAAQACRDGHGLHPHLGSACARCIFDATHADALDADLVRASSQLAVLLRTYDTQIVIGERLPGRNAAAAGHTPSGLDHD